MGCGYPHMGPTQACGAGAHFCCVAAEDASDHVVDFQCIAVYACADGNAATTMSVTVRTKDNSFTIPNLLLR